MPQAGLRRVHRMKNIKRRTLLQALGSALALSPFAAFAAFPERAIRLIGCKLREGHTHDLLSIVDRNALDIAQGFGRSISE